MYHRQRFLQAAGLKWHSYTAGSGRSQVAPRPLAAEGVTRRRWPGVIRSFIIIGRFKVALGRSQPPTAAGVTRRWPEAQSTLYQKSIGSLVWTEINHIAEYLWTVVECTPVVNNAFNGMNRIIISLSSLSRLSFWHWMNLIYRDAKLY